MGLDSYTQHVVNNLIVCGAIAVYPAPTILLLVLGAYEWHVQRRINGRLVGGLVLLIIALVIAGAWTAWIQMQ